MKFIVDELPEFDYKCPFFYMDYEYGAECTLDKRKCDLGVIKDDNCQVIGFVSCRWLKEK